MEQVSQMDMERVKMARENQDVVEELRRQNSGFVQVYDRGWQTLRNLILEQPGAARLWTVLAEHIDSEHGAVVASQSTLAELLDVHERTIRRWVKALEDCGAIVVVHLGGKASVYALDPHAVWRSWDARKDRAVFKTKTILGKKQAGVVEKRLKHLIARRPQKADA